MHLLQGSYFKRVSYPVESAGNAVSDTCAEFKVKYVGGIEKLHFEMSKTLQEPLDLISYIDAAQVRMSSDIYFKGIVY